MQYAVRMHYTYGRPEDDPTRDRPSDRPSPHAEARSRMVFHDLAAAEKFLSLVGGKKHRYTLDCSLRVWIEVHIPFVGWVPLDHFENVRADFDRAAKDIRALQQSEQFKQVPFADIDVGEHDDNL